MRAEMTAEFYVIAPNLDSVSIAAQTLGNRTLEPDHLKIGKWSFCRCSCVVAAK